MKRIIKLFSILFLITLTLVGCSDSHEKNAKEVGEAFVRNLYTVDANKVAEFKKLEGQIPPLVSIIGEGVPKGSVTGPNEKYTKITQSLDKKTQPLMTEKGYEAIVASRFNLLSTIICVDHNYTLQVTDFILGENVYGEKDDTVRHHYEAKLKFISTDGKAEQTDVTKGYIELLKEDGQWKVCMYGITTFPKLYR
jgi:hypothetical protein